MEVKANKSVRFNSDTDLKFSKLSEKLGRSKQELFGQMVDYFYKSKKDPGDLNDEMLKKELGQGINRIIAFIKTQEKETLTPLLADQRETQQALVAFYQQFVAFFSVDDERYVHGFYSESQDKRRTENQKLLANQQELNRQQQEMAVNLQNLLSEARSYQKQVNDHLESKGALKDKFSALLEGYIQQRDALNMLTQGRAVRDLQDQVRQQLLNL